MIEPLLGRKEVSLRNLDWPLHVAQIAIPVVAEPAETHVVTPSNVFHSVLEQHAQNLHFHARSTAPNRNSEPKVSLNRMQYGPRQNAANLLGMRESSDQVAIWRRSTSFASSSSSSCSAAWNPLDPERDRSSSGCNASGSSESPQGLALVPLGPLSLPGGERQATGRRESSDRYAGLFRQRSPQAKPQIGSPQRPVAPAVGCRASPSPVPTFSGEGGGEQGASTSVPLPMPRPGGLSPTPPRVRARRMSALDTAPWAAALPPRASWQGASLPSAPRGAGPSMGAAASGGASGAGGGGNGGGGGVARRASISLPDAVERPRGGLAKPTAARGPGPAACPDPYHSALVPPRTAAGGPHSCMAPPRTGGGGLQQSVEFTLPPAMPSASNGTGLPPAPNGRPISRVLSDLKYRLRVFSASSRPNSPPKTTARSRANSVRRRASSHVEQPQQPAPHIHQPTLPPAPLSRANSTWIERLRANQVLSSTAAELAAAKAEAATEAAVPLGLLPDASEGGARSTRG